MFSKTKSSLAVICLLFASMVATPALAANLLFYRTDGLTAVGHIDGSGKFQQTDSRSDFSPNWSRIVSTP